MEEEAPQPSGYYMQPVDGGGIRDSKRYVQSPLQSPTSDTNEPPNYKDAINNQIGWVFKPFSQLYMKARKALNAPVR